jgi:hypothetical protein
MDSSQLKEEVPLAIVGIVPCKVTATNGSIEVGDLLVTSASPGRAMKGTDRTRMLGAVVGKALEPLSSGEGVIQVLVTCSEWADHRDFQLAERKTSGLQTGPSLRC